MCVQNSPNMFNFAQVKLPNAFKRKHCNWMNNKDSDIDVSYN